MDTKKLAKYSPFEAKHLTQEDIAAMAEFTKDDVKELAAAYPNSSTPSGAYLVLRDNTKPENKQLFPLSTWPNLWDLLKLGQTNFVVHAFRAGFKGRAKVLKTAPVQDLTIKQAKEQLKAPLGVAEEQVGTFKPDVIPSAPVTTNKDVEKAAPVKEAKAKGKTKTAQQIAEEESKSFAEDFNAAEATKDVLLEKHKELFGKPAKKGILVPELRKVIIKKLTGK